MARVRDRLWIWGQEAGCHTAAEWGVPEPSRMTPAEGAFYMGIPNVLIVGYGDKPAPPFHQYAMPLKPLKRVVWSVVGAGGVTDAAERTEVLKLAEELPNMTGVMMDDFFHDEPREKGYGALTLDELRDMRSQLTVSGRKLDLWVVIYDRQLGLPLREYLELCDTVTLWFWRAAELKHLEQSLEALEKLAPSCKKVLGCYMFDYGEKRPMPLDLLEHECETGLKWLREGRIEGMIFLATCICDLDLEAVEWSRRWIAKVGDQKL